MVAGRAPELLVRAALVGASIAATVAVAELAVRASSIGERLGWRTSPSLGDRIERGVRAAEKADVVIGAFGDSFVEYRIGTEHNLAAITEAQLRARGIDASLPNFGFMATGVRDYVANFDVVRRRMRMDAAVFHLFLGNDVLDYWLAHRLEAQGRRTSPLPDSQLGAPPRPAWRRTLGRSILLTAAWQRIGRGWLGFSTGKLERDFVRHCAAFEVPRAVCEERRARIPPELIHLARTHQISPWRVAMAVANPTLPADTTRGFGPATGVVLRRMIEDLVAWDAACRSAAIRCVVAFIPQDLAVSDAYHWEYAELGYEVDPRLVARAPLEVAVADALGAGGLPTLSLREPLVDAAGRLYIERDGHLNAAGNRVAGAALAAWLAATLDLDPSSEASGRAPP